MINIINDSFEWKKPILLNQLEWNTDWYQFKISLINQAGG